jgi:hypothetical protein
VLAFAAFEDTFRRERSAVYREAVAKRRRDVERACAREGINEEKPGEHVIHKNMVEAGGQPVSAPGSAQSTRTPSPTLPNPPDPAVAEASIRLTLLDVSPLRPMLRVLRRPNNAAILTSSGLIYAFSYCISYTSARTLGSRYGFDALKIGLVLLAYGVGECSL